MTIHSFSGIGLGIESAEVLVTKIKKNKKAASRWMRTKVLIIDEGVPTDAYILSLVHEMTAYASINGRWRLV